MTNTARKILVVDDNMDAAETLALLLRARGHEVRVAHDGASALEVSRTFEPEAALLDIGLPQFDGYELARRMRGEQRRQLLLIALTGYGRDDDRRLSAAAGFDHHLVKPVDFLTVESLLASVTEAAGVSGRCPEA
jgi:CheY-like chemotaxis protein